MKISMGRDFINQSRKMKINHFFCLTLICILFTYCELPEKNKTYYLSEYEKNSIPYKLNDKLSFITESDSFILTVTEDTLHIVFMPDPLITYYTEERTLKIQSNDSISQISILLKLSKAAEKFHMEIEFEEKDSTGYLFNVDVFDPFGTDPSKVREYIGDLTILNKAYKEVVVFKSSISNEDPFDKLYFTREDGLLMIESNKENFYFKN